MTFYYVSGTIHTHTDGTNSHAVMENTDGRCAGAIAFCPFNPNTRDGWGLALADASKIVAALNARKLQ
jgi:hypothetical protein